MRTSTRLVPVVLMSLAGAALAQPEPPPGPYPGHQMVTVTPRSAEEVDAVYANIVAAWSCVTPTRDRPGPVDVQVTPAQRALLEAMGIPLEVRIADVQGAIDAERAQIDAARAQNDDAWYVTYRTLAEMHARLDTLAGAHPTLATTFVAGSTLQGRPIKGIRLQGPDQPGNPRSARPAVMFEGCQHAREWISPMTNLYIAETLLERYAAGEARARNILDHAEIIVVPVINADGYEFTWTPNNRLWRKNRRSNGDGTTGVDLNRNWGYQWGGEGASTATNSDTYRGAGPFSEPETQVMRDFITANPRLRAHIDFHSFSQLVLSPSGYTAALPPNARLFDRLNATLTGAIFSVHAQTYIGGPSYTTIYPASGVAPDWVYGDRGVLAWTIEERDEGQFGFELPADQILPTAEENYHAALTLAEQVLAPFLIEPESVPTTVPSGGAPATFTVYQAAASLAGPPVLFARVQGGSFAPVAMSGGTNNRYTASVAGGACGEVIEYYVQAQAGDGRTTRYPADAPASVLSATSAGTGTIRFSDDMEADRGWTVGAAGDTATLGVWQRGVPQATAAQPGSTPSGTSAWITGLAAGTGVGSFDVDGGATTLTSPRFSALPTTFTLVTGTYLSYQRWYSNNQGAAPNADSMPVLVSNNDGATWVTIEDVSENAGVWVSRSFRLEDFVVPTNLMRVRFQARDLGAGSIVEAGVDDVVLRVEGCAPNLDLNNDGNADQNDLDYLVNVIGGGANPEGIDPDFNRDGVADQVDVDDFIRALAGG